MNETIVQGPVVPATTSQDVLTEILRDGAQQLLGQAIEAEVQGWLESHEHLLDEKGHRQVVGNGRLPTCTIVTGVGPVEVSQRRVHDRRIVGVSDHGEPIDVNGRTVERFGSKILPPYLRKTKSIEELIPWLYLKGVSTGDFTGALQALLGKDSPGLSAATISRLVGTWQKDYQAWNTRSLEAKQYVYIWVDGVHFNIRLQEDRSCILVLMGPTAEGKKELIVVADELRESKLMATRCTNADCAEKNLWLPPRTECPDCWHETEWVEAPPVGTIYTHSVVKYPGASFRLPDGTPLISIEIEGVCTKLMSWLKEGQPDFGMKVEAVFNTENPTNTILDLAWIPA